MTGDHRDLWRQGRARRTAGYRPRHARPTSAAHRRPRAGRHLALLAVLAELFILGLALSL